MNRISLLALLALILAMPVARADTIIQLFFDDFQSSEFPAQWTTPVVDSFGNVTQNGGYVTLSVSRYAAKALIFGESGLYANNSGPPIINSTTPDGTLVYNSWKIYPFNMTLASPKIGRIGELQFGLTSQGLLNLDGTATASIYYDLMIQDFPKNSFMTLYPNDKEVVAFALAGPNPSAAHCFDSTVVLAAITCDRPIIKYSGISLDLNTVHTFNMEMKLYPVSHKSWVTFWVDNNAMMNITTLACGCMDSNSGSYVPMYPFIHLAYVDCVTLNGGAGTGCPLTTQSLGSNIDWVLFTNGVPASLPGGQLLSSNINPPLHNQGIYQPGGFSLTQYVQFQANEIGQGNIYAGGLFLTGVFLLIITLGLGGVFWKLRLGLSIFGMIWNISTLAFIYLMFYCGVIPLVIPVLITIGAAAIMFGIFRSGPPSIGGEIEG